MGRTATFKSGERRVRPTGSDAGADTNTENSLFREVDAHGNPVVTVQSEGAYPLAESTPIEVTQSAPEPSEFDNKQDVFEPSDEEVAQFNSLVASGMSETEAAAEIWPGVEFDTDDEAEDVIEAVTGDGNETQDENTSEEEEFVIEVTEEELVAAENEAEVEEDVTEEQKDAESDGDEETAAEEVARKYPEGEPTDKWLVSSIDAWAADQNPVIEFPKGATKPQKLTFIKEAQTD